MKLRFSNRSAAVRKQNQMKKMYGYRPSIFTMKSGGRQSFMIVKPRGLQKL